MIFELILEIFEIDIKTQEGGANLSRRSDAQHVKFPTFPQLEGNPWIEDFFSKNSSSYPRKKENPLIEENY